MPRNLAPIELRKQTAPGTPATNIVSLYAKTDGKVYSKDEAGTEYDLTATGSIPQAYKDPVRVASTGSNVVIATGTLLTIDGITLVANDRVLLKDQTTASQNGIYLAASGAWSRATDMDTSVESPPGMQVMVTEGTLNGDTLWALTTNAAITLGSTSLTFQQQVSVSDDVFTLMWMAVSP